MPFTAKKLYYKIGEACEIVGVESHVLRYWEREFACLAPPKNRSGQRTYRPKDIELLLRIRRLLYEDGFTIAGARRQLDTGASRAVATSSGKDSVGVKRGRKAPSESAPAAKHYEKVRKELENILTLLDRG